MLMSIVPLTSYKMCWSEEFRRDKIASIMSLKRYETLWWYFDVNDNTKKNYNSRNGFKVTPL